MGRYIGIPASRDSVCKMGYVCALFLRLTQ